MLSLELSREAKRTFDGNQNDQMEMTLVSFYQMEITIFNLLSTRFNSYEARHIWYLI